MSVRSVTEPAQSLVHPRSPVRNVTVRVRSSIHSSRSLARYRMSRHVRTAAVPVRLSRRNARIATAPDISPARRRSRLRSRPVSITDRVSVSPGRVSRVRTAAREETFSLRLLYPEARYSCVRRLPSSRLYRFLSQRQLSAVRSRSRPLTVRLSTR